MIGMYFEWLIEERWKNISKSTFNCENTRLSNIHTESMIPGWVFNQLKWAMIYYLRICYLIYVDIVDKCGILQKATISKNSPNIVFVKLLRIDWHLVFFCLFFFGGGRGGVTNNKWLIHAFSSRSGIFEWFYYFIFLM